MQALEIMVAQARVISPAPVAAPAGVVYRAATDKNLFLSQEHAIVGNYEDSIAAYELSIGSVER
eukprot:COSAG05_NODE_5002_length_1296_cov_1.162907_1_plen_64_part_00